ncbi:MAG: hypothetical protein HQL20_08730 [Candidatus Omnitrophica bacterium]|nr:hypothetical protein [Candidatus Omnitrophota bacterium]
MPRALFHRRYLDNGLWLWNLVVTEERISVSVLFGLVIFDEALADISGVQIFPVALGAKVRFKLKDASRRAFELRVGSFGDLTAVLRQLHVKVECDEAALQKGLKRERFFLSRPVQILSVSAGVILLVFLIYNIVLSAFR